MSLLSFVLFSFTGFCYSSLICTVLFKGTDHLFGCFDTIAWILHLLHCPQTLYRHSIWLAGKNHSLVFRVHSSFHTVQTSSSFRLNSRRKEICVLEFQNTLHVVFFHRNLWRALLRKVLSTCMSGSWETEINRLT